MKYLSSLNSVGESWICSPSRQTSWLSSSSSRSANLSLGVGSAPSPLVRQHHVEHDEVGPVTLRGLYRLGSGCRRDDVETRVAQARGQQLEDVRLVLDDEQLRIRSLPRIGQRFHAVYCRLSR